jgi:hypothetical protein
MDFRWDDSIMSEKNVENLPDHGPHQHAHTAPSTQQMRTVGQRRRDAEEKLEHHLQEARHKDNLHHSEAAKQEGSGAGDSRDAATIQSYGR